MYRTPPATPQLVPVEKPSPLTPPYAPQSVQKPLQDSPLTPSYITQLQPKLPQQPPLTPPYTTQMPPKTLENTPLLAQPAIPTYSPITPQLPTTYPPAPPTLTIPPNAKRHAQLAVRTLSRRARELAEKDYNNDPKRQGEAPALTNTAIKKRMRNRSAYISRQASRHYEKLLVQHIVNSENERNQEMGKISKIASEVECLRFLLDSLQTQLHSSTLLDDIITN